MAKSVLITLAFFSYLEVVHGYCYYGCWYGSWYFWFGGFWVIVFAIAGIVACIQYCNKSNTRVRPNGAQPQITVISQPSPPKPPAYGVPSQGPPSYNQATTYNGFPNAPHPQPAYPPNNTFNQPGHSSDPVYPPGYGPTNNFPR